MTKAMTLEELVKKYLSDNPSYGKADTYDIYKHKTGTPGAKSYSDAAAAIYASSKKATPNYGSINRKISNKGLQNSGYSSYISSLSKSRLSSELDTLKSDYAKSEASKRSSYASYLENHKDKQNGIKKSVMSHLVNNDVVDLNTATAYGISAGLSMEDAAMIGRSAYEVTKQKVFNRLLEQTVSLGLDKDGAKLLAVKMGVSEEDANQFADEIDELIGYYRNISDEYLEYLEERSNKS